MIKVQELSKVFYSSNKKSLKDYFVSKSIEVRAVNNINFQCKPGRVFGLIGPNGAGKTTTLRMIATMLKPTSGNISICDIDVASHPLEVKKKIGFLSSNTGLYDRLTVEEMIKYYADLTRMEESLYLERRDKLFSQLNMHDMANRRIAKLSTGMKQKVSIVRTIIHDPDIIIFDEPTSGLDVMTSQSIITLINECKKAGKTVIFSSHRFGEIKLLCDDLAIIHNGILYFNGSYNEFESQMQADTLENEFIRLIREIK